MPLLLGTLFGCFASECVSGIEWQSKKLKKESERGKIRKVKRQNKQKDKSVRKKGMRRKRRGACVCDTTASPLACRSAVEYRAVRAVLTVLSVECPEQWSSGTQSTSNEKATEEQNSNKSNSHSKANSNLCAGCLSVCRVWPGLIISRER